MKNRVNNHLDMVGTCINVADKPEFAALINTPPPTDFVGDIAALKTEYASVTAAAAAAYAATTGPADAKDIAETALEDLAYPLARALCVHYKKTGNLTDRAKVDFTKSAIVRLRDQQLKTTCELIRDLANEARDESGAMGRGVTSARVLALTGAINAYAAVMSAPRGQIVVRSTKIRDVETRTAALIERLPDLDDLVLQYDTTEVGRAFIAAWKSARIIVDAGHGPGEDAPANPPTPPPANPPTP
jgi:hypothetical protein